MTTAARILDLSLLTRAQGFIIQGDSVGDYAGWSVSLAGDVNGDGIDDLIVGAPKGDDGGNWAGEAYVIFGTASAARADIDLTTLAASDGFIIQGDSAGDYAGHSVSSAGDVNNDGIDDLIVGAPRGDDAATDAGEAYVIFGHTGASRSNIDLTSLTALDGLTIRGGSAFGFAGQSVSSAGDMNGDGIDDLVVGVPHGTGRVGYDHASETFVIFGKAGALPADLDLSSPAVSDYFVIRGRTNDQMGSSVSSAGDVNHDGIDDLIIGAHFASRGGYWSGDAYVIYGKVGTTRDDVDVTNLPASDGFAIKGDIAWDFTGDSVSSAGDLNNDGIDDLIIGAPHDNNRYSPFGLAKAYVIYGKVGETRANIDLSTLRPKDGFLILGGSNDGTGQVSSAGDVNGDGIDDLIVGAHLSDNGGAAYVIFGKTGETRANIDLTTLAAADGFIIQGDSAYNHVGLSWSAP